MGLFRHFYVFPLFFIFCGEHTENLCSDNALRKEHAFKIATRPAKVNSLTDTRAVKYAELNRIRQNTRTGRPSGDGPFIEKPERLLKRLLRPMKRGPKTKQDEENQLVY
ncbi:MAG: hypothetical protein NTX50_16530 [Candidatus Sumerlaeota bacterium]|nr:hypothetical protein [Candidatus Sumerlaeota bacterium]